jgi:NAD(P)-dependent dehydrogenase (short-subunit alcohol dehydrogenase family)
MNKVALVTGASGGIGRAVCLSLAEAGFDIAIHYRRGAEKAEILRREVIALGRRAEALQADLSDSAQLYAPRGAVHRKAGRAVCARPTTRG